MNQLLGFEMLWDLSLHLQAQQVPRLQIGRKAAAPCALGWTTWLAHKATHGDRSDLRLEVAQARNHPSVEALHHG